MINTNMKRKEKTKRFAPDQLGTNSANVDTLVNLLAYVIPVTLVELLFPKIKYIY